jgi:pimeloyl-ACP methyl ester carboxylesterase
MKAIYNLLLILALSFNLSFPQIAGSSYLKVDNDKIFYETAGKGTAIIFIHDGLVHSQIWDSQFSFFARDHMVIRYDRRGYGKSSTATGNFSNMDDLRVLFNHLKIEKACLMALSSGGRLAIDFTLQYPEKVSSLVLVGAVVGGFSYTQHFFTRGGHLPSGLKNMDQRVAYYIFEDPYEIYGKNKEAKQKVDQFLKKYPRKRLHSPANKKQSKNRDGINRVPTKPAYERLSEIKIPALILVGEFDIPDVHAHAGVINAGIKNSKRVIIGNSGHLIPLEQPKIFNNEIKKFLEKLSSNH